MTHLSRNLTAQERCGEPEVAKIDVVKLSFGALLTACLTYWVIVASPQQIRNRQEEGKRMAPTGNAQHH